MGLVISIGLIAILSIANILTQASNTVLLFLMASSFAVPFFCIYEMIESKLIGIRFYHDKMMIRKVFYTQKQSYNDVAAIYLLPSRIRCYGHEDRFAINIQYEKGRFRLKKRAIYNFGLISSLDENWEKDLKTVFEQSTEALKLSLGDCRIITLRVYEDVLRELYSHRLYPIYLTTGTLQDNYPIIMSAIKHTHPDASFKLESHDGYVVIRPECSDCFPKSKDHKA